MVARHVSPADPCRGSDAFGLTRLVLAALVIAAHTPELHDGDRGREMLTRMFGTISFGELAVDGFFIVSGFLVTGSYLATGSPRLFVAKRAARLLPGFWLASLICLTAVVPLAGGTLADVGWRAVAWSIAGLHDVTVPGIFQGLHYPSLDGAMWTLAFEARCYGLVMLLGAAGLLRRPLALGIIAGACLLGQLFAPVRWLMTLYADPLTRLLFGDPGQMLRLAAQFLAGAALWSVRDRLDRTPARTVVAVVALIAGLSRPLLAEAAVASAGAWLILSWSLHPPARWMAAVNRRDDISYGIYLYAWPLTNLMLWYVPNLPLVPLGLLTLAGSALLGLLSWRLVERPAQRMVRAGASLLARRRATGWASA